MSRVSKTEVNRVLALAAKRITDASGSDGRVSRADMKQALSGLEGAEKKLVSVFYKFMDHRDHKPGATLTERDVKRALAYASEHLVATYDLNNNGLSEAEIKKMSLTGKLAVDMAKALMGASEVVPTGKGPQAFETWHDFLNRMKIGSEKKFTEPRGIDSTLEKQIIAATHESTHDGVKTLAEAFAVVDQGEFAVRRVQDPVSKKKYVLIDYGAGDNTYGAIFLEGKTKPLAGIHDGDIYPA